MCGCAGVLSRDGMVTEDLLRGMASTLHHRGPDDSGVWFDPATGIGLAHTRLAILDLSCAGGQPMRSPSGKYMLAFNGEIYNHLLLRMEMERSGSAPRWAGHSDTETLCAGFELWGIEATVRRAVGMFAFGVWDVEDRSLTIGRDRLGEKPLYYGWQGGDFMFASELKALRAHPSFEDEIDRDAVATFMRFGFIPAPQSIYRGIKKLRPGTLLRTRSHGPELEPTVYWSAVEAARVGVQHQFKGSDSDAIGELETRLSTAVALQQISDVPIGAFLSGGVDSSTIVALMQAGSTGRVNTFTIGFMESQHDEAVHARAVAQHLGTDHTEMYVTPEQSRAVIPLLPSLYDEPFADVSQIPTFLVSQLARQRVTVSLSGDGGDELFGGYNRYLWARRVQSVPTWMRSAFAFGLTSLTPVQWDQVFEVMRPVLPRRAHLRTPGDKAHKLASVIRLRSEGAIHQRLLSAWEPVELGLSGDDRTRLSRTWDGLTELESPEHRMMALDAVSYLPDDILCKVDRAAMGVSLETRVPFLDHRVFEFAWTLPLHMKVRHGQGKWILRELLHKRVPKALVERPKMGFGVPIGAWLRGPLRGWAEDLLDEGRLRQEGYLDAAIVSQTWKEHLSGKRDWKDKLWTVLMFQSWLRDRASVRKPVG